MDGEVRILLLGEPGVGKTSLIYSLINDEFEEKPPARIADITVGPDDTAENIPLRITDYSARVQTHDELCDAIRDSHVICAIYDVNQDVTLFRISDYWIPMIRNCQSASTNNNDNSDPANNTTTPSRKPIVLVANKADWEAEKMSFDKVASIIQEFAEVEAFIEVSALTQRNVVEMFSTAQKAVLYPLAPLFDPQQRVLTEKCHDALVDVFRRCDKDSDGLLSDYELNLFQEHCFGTPLQKDALDDLKSIIKQFTPDGLDYKNGWMTLTGFLFLHTLSIDKGRLDFTWQVLKKFNYSGEFETSSSGKSKELMANVSQEARISSDHTSSIFLSTTQRDRTTFEDPIGNFVGGVIPVDLSWVRDNPRLVKAGFGFTLAALLGMLTLRYVIRGGKSFA